MTPAETSLELSPQMRFDVIDVTTIAGGLKDFLAEYKRALYCSYHTTAGYLEQSLCARLKHSSESVQTFLSGFRRLFPPDADYHHDQIHLRHELSDEQKLCEPKNADSHLTFIGSGLKNCVVYTNRPDTPVYFIDLDGVCGNERRRRRTTVIGFNREETVKRARFAIPASKHHIDAVNLKDQRLGLLEMLQEEIRRLGLEKGRVRINLDPEESHAGLTMNEYETLLMQHDIAEVLRNPLKHMAEKGKSILRDPRSIPNKTLNYAKYDLVQVVNGLVEVVGISDTRLESLIEALLTVTATRFLRMERGVDLPISDGDDPGRGQILEGTYQSPILLQWNKANRRRRALDVSFVRFV